MNRFKIIYYTTVKFNRKLYSIYGGFGNLGLMNGFKIIKQAKCLCPLYSSLIKKKMKKE